MLAFIFKSLLLFGIWYLVFGFKIQRIKISVHCWCPIGLSLLLFDVALQCNILIPIKWISMVIVSHLQSQKPNNSFHSNQMRFFIHFQIVSEVYWNIHRFLLLFFCFWQEPSFAVKIWKLKKFLIKSGGPCFLYYRGMHFFKSQECHSWLKRCKFLITWLLTKVGHGGRRLGGWFP